MPQSIFINLLNFLHRNTKVKIVILMSTLFYVIISFNFNLRLAGLLLRGSGTVHFFRSVLGKSYAYNALRLKNETT